MIAVINKSIRNILSEKAIGYSPENITIMSFLLTHSKIFVVESTVRETIMISYLFNIKL